MNRAPALARLSRSFMQQQVRHGGGGPVVVGARWANIVRGESNITTPDEPPTAPLSDDHEVGDGTSDFARYYDNHDELSSTEIVAGLSFGLSLCFGIYLFSQSSVVSKPSTFTPRENPTFEFDLPTADHSILRGSAKQTALNEAAEQKRKSQ